MTLFRFTVILFTWVLLVTGVLTWISGQPEPFVGAILGGLLWLPAVWLLERT